jgi:hypothetical protein
MTKKELIDALNELTDDDNMDVFMMGYPILSVGIPEDDGFDECIQLMDFV